MNTTSQAQFAQNPTETPVFAYLTADQIGALRIAAIDAGKTETQLAAEMIGDGLRRSARSQPTIDHVVTEINRASYAIEACNRLAEALRAHATEEMPLDDYIDELANGFVIGGLSAAIGVLSRIINVDTEILRGAV